MGNIGKIVLVAVLAFLTGCGTVEKDDWFPLNAEASRVASSPELARRFLSDTTRLSFNQNQHGTQYEYHSEGGRVFLWYPGNRSIVHGSWRIESSSTGRNPNLCYRYGAGSFNPVTGQRGGSWECRSFLAIDVAGGGTLKGDPFSLGAGRIPFVMVGRDFYSPDSVMQAIGKDPALLDYISNVSEID